MIFLRGVLSAMVAAFWGQNVTAARQLIDNYVDIQTARRIENPGADDRPAHRFRD
jgi:hypothetical protein